MEWHYHAALVQTGREHIDAQASAQMAYLKGQALKQARKRSLRSGHMAPCLQEADNIWMTADALVDAQLLAELLQMLLPTHCSKVQKCQASSPSLSQFSIIWPPQRCMQPDYLPQLALQTDIWKVEQACSCPSVVLSPGCRMMARSSS